MAGLSREDLIGLSAKDLAVKLTEVGVPKSLTEALHGKCCILLYLFSLLLNITVLHGVLIFASLLLPTAMGIKGSTLLLMDAEDIKYELSELFVEERIHLRNFLREIVSFGV